MTALASGRVSSQGTASNGIQPTNSGHTSCVSEASARNTSAIANIAAVEVSRLVGVIGLTLASYEPRCALPYPAFVMSTHGRTFALAYGRIHALLVVLGLGPAHSLVELTDERLSVRMGWAFHAEVPRPAIRNPIRDRDWPWAIGVHTNMKGSWLVNGSATRIVAMDVVPPVRAAMAGFPITVRRLGLSLEDPDGFLAAVTPPEPKA